MARTIEEIKQTITSEWLRNEQLRKAYEINDGATWENTFSSVSIENLICYVVAVALWVHEKLFDIHRKEVDDYIQQMKPHSLRWYVSKAKLFRLGQSLIEGTDTYSNTKSDGSLYSETEISSMQPVKFASASESRGVIYIKVATDNEGSKAPLPPEHIQGLRNYLQEIKDAGVQISLINEQGYKLKAEINILYDPMVLGPSGRNLSTGSNNIEQAIKNYIENLPFNGEFRKSELIDRLQAVEGVVIPELKSIEESYDGINYNEITLKSVPFSGYYVYDTALVNINYIAYEYTSN